MLTKEQLKWTLEQLSIRYINKTDDHSIKVMELMDSLSQKYNVSLHKDKVSK